MRCYGADKNVALQIKFWVSNQDHKRLDSISNDTEYASEQLTLIRNDLRYKFTSEDKEILNTVLEDYNRATANLSTHKPKIAIKYEKRAYRTLRKFPNFNLKRNIIYPLHNTSWGVR